MLAGSLFLAPFFCKVSVLDRCLIAASNRGSTYDVFFVNICFPKPTPRTLHTMVSFYSQRQEEGNFLIHMPSKFKSYTREVSIEGGRGHTHVNLHQKQDLIHMWLHISTHVTAHKNICGCTCKHM